MFVIIIIILLVVVIYYYFRNSSACWHTHSENGLNYPWLNRIHGGLSKIQYMEPPSSGTWRDYTDEIWKIHCRVISHDPENLVKDHLKAFVNPDTRFAKLKFKFNDGFEAELDEKHGKEYYELEANYFRN